jgi:metallo-beta-lactamase class B
MIREIARTQIRKGAWMLLLLVARLVMAPSAAAQNAGAKEALIPKPTKVLYNPPYPNNDVKPFKIVGNVYYVGLTNFAAFLVSTPDGLILIDTMDHDFVPKLKAHIAALGFKVSDIKILLQAHAHVDHVGGLAELKKETGATVYVMAEDASVLADGGVSDFRNFDGKQLWAPVKADKLLKDGDKVSLGGVTLTALRTPAHTKGCTTWTMDTTDGGKKYSVVFACSQRLNDGVPMVNNPKYPNYAADFAMGFAKLKTLHPDVWVASHAFMFDLEGKLAKMKPGSPNPFIDREGFQQYVKDWENEYRYNLQEEKASRPAISTTRR